MNEINQDNSQRSSEAVPATKTGARGKHDWPGFATTSRRGECRFAARCVATGFAFGPTGQGRKPNSNTGETSYSEVSATLAASSLAVRRRHRACGGCVFPRALGHHDPEHRFH